MTRLLWVGGLAAGLALMVAASAIAQPKGQPQPGMGMGGVLCRDYLRAARSSDILYHQASQWLLGFASGMNGALKTVNGAEAPIALTSDQALKSASADCEASPASALGDVAAGWYAALPKAQPAEGEVKSAPRNSGSLFLDLDKAPSRKPLLDRH